MSLINPQHVPSKISVLILAGGRATRMQGVDKGLVKLKGKTLVERIYNQISEYSDDILISANRNQAVYQNLLPDCRIITDEWSDFRGPLAGIYSGLNAAKHDYLWVIPCDLMILPEHCLQQLWQTLISTHSQVVYARFNQQAFYPLCLLNLSVKASLQDALQQQQFAVRHWLNQQHAAVVDFKVRDDQPLNLNTLQDVELAENCYIITEITPMTAQPTQE